MKKLCLIILTIVVSFIFFSFGTLSISIAGSPSGQVNSKTVQPQTKTTTESIKPKTKSAQGVNKSGQLKTPATQKNTKLTQVKTKTAEKTPPKSEGAKTSKDSGIIVIGKQNWSATNLNVNTFRNGDSIPEVKTNKEWVVAAENGKPAWCYYNNNPAIGAKYGKLYNWYAVSDPRGLAPEGWVIPSEEDWSMMANSIKTSVGSKMKTTTGWSDGYNGTNESGFAGFPGGYRVENGAFMNIGGIGIWWSSTESKPLTSVDHYLSQNNSLSLSSSHKGRGESVRCLKK